MALKIDSSTVQTKHVLTVRSDGVQFVEGVVGAPARSFRFSQIDCVLLSPGHRLSFQVDKEIFSIPTAPADSMHLDVIATFVSELKRSAGGGFYGND